MKIYVAGASSNIDNIERYIAALKAGGHTITVDWTIPVRKLGASPESKQERLAAATQDLSGVAEAQVLWLVQPDESSTSTGAWVELGYALGYQGSKAVSTKIIVSGRSMKCIFADLADMRFTNHEDALDYILFRMAK